jgi:hypothetical protein
LVRRRTFVGALGAAAGIALLSRRARASFGEFAAGAQSLQLPDGVRAKRILEVFLYGGLSPWETLYFVRDYGRADRTQFYAFENDNLAMAQLCGGGDAARVVGSDALGAPVELGPFAWRLWERPDVVARMRLVVQRHALEPHEAAIPLALTGVPLGHATAAGLGTHVAAARLAAGSSRASPHSYVLATGGVASDNVAAAVLPGGHPNEARPLLVKTDDASAFTRLLARPTVGAARGQHDALVQAYVDQYRQRLVWPGRGPARSKRTDDMAAAFATSTHVDALASVMPPDLFEPRYAGACGHPVRRDVPLTALTAAARLLAHPVEPATYVCISDSGLYEASGGGGYDTHDFNARDTATNFDNMLASLLAVINAPGEADPAKLSLDDTLIILNTEFGRTPAAQGDSGRNHHPYGYVTAFIGGPVCAGIAGAIGPDGFAARFATPAANRIAALLALGIWPFAPEAFTQDDAAAPSELDAAASAMTAFLGRTS